MAETEYFKSSLFAQEMEDTWTGTVRFNSEQSLSESQKAQACANIGATQFGTLLKILGHFDTVTELQASAPQHVGDAYSVGTAAPYNLYIFDGLRNEWMDYGQIRAADISARYVENQTIAVSAWTEDNSVLAGYNYRAQITISGATEDDFPIVAFDQSDAVSGNFAALSFAFDGYIEIWAKAKPTAAVTIPVATLIVNGGNGRGITNATGGIAAGSVGADSLENGAVTAIKLDDKAVKLLFKNVKVETSTFTADSTYEDYPYRAAVPLPGTLPSMIPEVIFGIADAVSGNYAPGAETFTNGAYIYAAEVPEATLMIPTVICWRGDTAKNLDADFTATLDGTNTTQQFKQWWPQTAAVGVTKYQRLERWFSMLAAAYAGKKYTLKYALISSSDPAMTPMDDLVGKTAAPVVTDAATDVTDWTEEDCMTWYIRANALSLADGTMNITYIEGEDGFDISGETAPVYTFSLALWLKEWDDENGNYKSWATINPGDYWPYEGDISPTNVKRTMTWHPTFGGGLTSDGKLTSGAGLASAIGISAVSGLAKAKLWNTYEGLWNDCDAKWLLDMWQLRHFNLENSSIVEGCTNYAVEATVSVAETGVKRVLIPKANLSTFIVSSSVSLSSTSRGGTKTFWNKKILSIETVTVNEAEYTAINIDTDTAFNTTAGYYLSTMPWFSGTTEALPGHSDGSIVSATSRKYPARIAGIEMLNGAYVIGIEPLWNVAVNSAGGMDYEAYYCRDSTKLAGQLTNYTASGLKFVGAAINWQYIKEFFKTKLGVLLPSVFGGNSSGWYKSAFYVGSSAGVRAPWRSGSLWDGGYAGLACAYGTPSPSSSNWNGAPRLGGAGKLRGEWVDD